MKDSKETKIIMTAVCIAVMLAAAALVLSWLGMWGWAGITIAGAAVAFVVAVAAPKARRRL